MNGYLDIGGMVAGLGLFLFGMRQLEASLEELAGRGFRQFLRESTARPIRSVIGGIVTTVIVQSSSLVGLIVLALVGAGVIPLVNAIGVIIGSNLGTTFTGWVVTAVGFKMNFSTAVFPMVAIGGIGYGTFSGKAKAMSLFLMGFALLLMGLGFMKDSVEALTQQFDVQALSEYSVLVFFLVGVLFTAVIQSSSATMMLTLSALNASVVSLPAAAALVIGANLGTTSTVVLGSVQGAVIKRRVAAAHFLFNVVVSFIALAALYPLLELVEYFRFQDPLYSLVMFHSLFNLVGILIFLPVLKPFTRFLENRIKDDQREVRRFIHNVPIDVPDLALEAIEKETEHLLFWVAHLNARETEVDLPSLDALARKYLEVTKPRSRTRIYANVKRLEGYLIEFAFELQQQALDANEVQKLERLLSAIRHAVYSAKALRDVRKDIRHFSDLDAPLMWHQTTEMKEIFLGTYTHIVSICCSEGTDEERLKEFKNLRKGISDKHHQLAQVVYDSSDTLKLSHTDLSTLFNVNNEIQTSEKALVRAFTRLYEARLLINESQDEVLQTDEDIVIEVDDSDENSR